jgi:hypothetical protein
MLVTATIANPKPLYPRMIPAKKTATAETIRDTSSMGNGFNISSQLITKADRQKDTANDLCYFIFSRS